MMNNAKRIIEDYNKAIQTLHKKVLRNLLICTVAFVLLTLAFLFLSNNGDIFDVLFFIFLILSIFVILICVLVKYIPFTNQKLLYNTIYPEVIKDINYNEDISLECEIFKKDKDYIMKGGLFTRYAAVDNKIQLEFLNKEGFQVNISDTTIITRSDKSTTIHFDGTYFVFKLDNRNLFQLRSNSSPKLSKTKFNRINTRDDIKEYVQEEDSQIIQSRFYKLVDYLKEKYPTQKIYIAGIEKEIHVAVWLGEKRAKYSSLSEKDLMLIRNQIMNHIALSEEIFNIIYI
ncbi:MAG: hypothetical protein JXR62_06570 [Bacilli bacterium]|nr:hypothetical protein [Bacilli bacterium]